MDIPCFHIAEPRAHDRNDLRINHPRQMAANRIVRQRRAVRTQRLDPAIRQEPQFDQRLETVADTQCQPVPLVKQIIQRFFQRRATEQGRNKFARTFRFIASTETARKHDDLRFGNAFCHFVDRFSQILWRFIAQHHDFRCCTSPFKGSGRIVFAVRTGADRDEYMRFTKGFTPLGSIGRKQGQ